MASKDDMRKKKRVVSPKARASFPSVFKAKSFDGNPAKFGITLLFDANADLSGMKKAVHACIVEKFGPDKENWPKKIKRPFRDGNEKDDLDGYKGKIFVTAYANTKPGVVDKDGETELTESDGLFYAGCYCRAQLNAFWFDKKGNKGVAFGLENVQKIAEGKPFSGKEDAKDVFDAVEDDEGDDDTDTSSDDDDGDDAGF